MPELVQAEAGGLQRLTVAPPMGGEGVRVHALAVAVHDDGRVLALAEGAPAVLRVDSGEVFPLGLAVPRAGAADGVGERQGPQARVGLGLLEVAEVVEVVPDGKGLELVVHVAPRQGADLSAVGPITTARK